MAGRKNDTKSQAEGTKNSLDQEDNTRIDVAPAPDRDPDTIIEEDPMEDEEPTRTDIATGTPDMTVVDRAAAPDTSTEVSAIGERTTLDSGSIEYTIPEATLADILPPGVGGATGQNGAEASVDDLTIVPSDTNE